MFNIHPDTLLFTGLPGAKMRQRLEQIQLSALGPVYHFFLLQIANNYKYKFYTSPDADMVRL